MSTKSHAPLSEDPLDRERQLRAWRDLEGGAGFQRGAVRRVTGHFEKDRTGARSLSQEIAYPLDRSDLQVDGGQRDHHLARLPLLGLLERKKRLGDQTSLIFGNLDRPGDQQG